MRNKMKYFALKFAYVHIIGIKYLVCYNLYYTSQYYQLNEKSH